MVLPPEEHIQEIMNQGLMLIALTEVAGKEITAEPPEGLMGISIQETPGLEIQVQLEVLTLQGIPALR